MLHDCLLTLLGKSVVADAARPRTKAVPEEETLDACVLLAEDNPVNQEVAVSMLELLGCKVEVAGNGREAVEAMSRRAFDLVLMDCHMPEMDGFAAATEIRLREQQDGDIRHVPVIALTANVQKGVQERCRVAGMDDYLSKPFTRDQLLRHLRRWLDNREIPAGSETPACATGLADHEETACILNREMLDRIRALQRPGKAQFTAKGHQPVH